MAASKFIYLTEEQRRKQYELILSDCTPEEIRAMLETAKKEGNELLIELIKKL